MDVSLHTQHPSASEAGGGGGGGGGGGIAEKQRLPLANLATSEKSAKQLKAEAKALLKDSEWADALELLERALTKDATDSEIYSTKGEAHLKATKSKIVSDTEKTHHLNCALEASLEALKRNQRSQKAYYQLGFARQKLGDYSQACSDISRAIYLLGGSKSKENQPDALISIEKLFKDTANKLKPVPSLELHLVAAASFFASSLASGNFSTSSSNCKNNAGDILSTSSAATLSDPSAASNCDTLQNQPTFLTLSPPKPPHATSLLLLPPSSAFQITPNKTAPTTNTSALPFKASFGISPTGLSATPSISNGPANSILANSSAGLAAVPGRYTAPVLQAVVNPQQQQNFAQSYPVPVFPPPIPPPNQMQQIHNHYINDLIAFEAYLTRKATDLNKAYPNDNRLLHKVKKSLRKSLKKGWNRMSEDLKRPYYQAGATMFPSSVCAAGGGAGGGGAITTTTAAVAAASIAKAAKEDGEDDFEDAVADELFNEYWPKKFSIGLAHPDSLIESSSLASVDLPDPEFQRLMKMPESIKDTGLLSSAQLETISYAMQSTNVFLQSGERQGFFLGDGAGVGKGRQLSGMIVENFQWGNKKSLWLSASADLYVDARRDLDDIGVNDKYLPVKRLLSYSYNENIDGNKGVLFSTYSLLVSKSTKTKTKYASRIDQIVQWLGGELFNGCILLDECHKAKNLSPDSNSKSSSKAALKVDELQSKLPNARVIYCSATGISEVRNMGYMSRLGIWGPNTAFRDFSDFVSKVESNGVGMMELIALHLKRRGQYISRTLSYKNCSFTTEEDAVEPAALKMYDDATFIWIKILKMIHHYTAPSRIEEFLTRFPTFKRKRSREGEDSDGDGDNVEEDDDDDDADVSTNPDLAPLRITFNANKGDDENYSVAIRRILTYYWGAHQRFFRSLNISLKLPCTIKLTTEALKKNQAVVIGLQSTGEAGVNSEIREAGEVNDLVSAPANCLKRIIYKLLPLPSVDSETKERLEAEAEKGRKTAQKAERESFVASSASHSKSSSSSSMKVGGAKMKLNGDDSEDDFVDDNGDDDDDEDNETVGAKIRKGVEKSAQKRHKSSNGDEDSRRVSDFSYSDAQATRRSSRATKPVVYNISDDEDEKEEEMEEMDEKKEKKAANGSSMKVMPSSLVGIKLPFVFAAPAIAATARPTSTPTPAPFHTHTHTPAHAHAHAYAYGIVVVEKVDYNLCFWEREKLMQEIVDLRLPGNPLDLLIDQLGGASRIAEMTGRKGRLLRNLHGKLVYTPRTDNGIPFKDQNIHERGEFMKGNKLIAIISDAASAGISLHADRRVDNQNRRVHITLELPWSAEKAIQQLGRSHRSNQSSSPHYYLLASPQGGERRFAASVARRIESFGALTQGDRSATVGSRGLTDFNLETKYGKQAVADLITDLFNRGIGFDDIPIEEKQIALASILEDKKFSQSLIDKKRRALRIGPAAHSRYGYGGAGGGMPDTPAVEVTLDVNDITTVVAAQYWLKCVGIDQDALSSGSRRGSSKEIIAVPRFLNRILGLKTFWQSLLFNKFISNMEASILEAKKSNIYDKGIKQYGDGQAKVELKEKDIVWRATLNPADNFTECYAMTINERITWDVIYQTIRPKFEDKGYGVFGFYISKNPFAGRHNVVLACEKEKTYNTPVDVIVYRPASGRHEMNRMEFNAKYRKVTSDNEANAAWDDEYTRNLERPDREIYILTGTIIPIFNIVNDVFVDFNRKFRSDASSKKEILRVSRATIQLGNADTDADGDAGVDIPAMDTSSSNATEKIMGLYIPPFLIRDVRDALENSMRAVEDARIRREFEKQNAAAAVAAAAAAKAITLSSGVTGGVGVGGGGGMGLGLGLLPRDEVKGKFV